MRRDKIVARILLIFSVTNAVLAAPAVVQQRRFVTDRAGVKSTSPGPSSLGSETGPPSESGYLPDFEGSPGPDTPPLLSDDSDTSSSLHLSSNFGTDRYYSDPLSESHFNSLTHSSVGSSSSSLHPAEAPVSQLENDPPSMSGAQQFNDPPPKSGTSELHNIPLATSGRPPSQDHDPTPASPEAAQLHKPPGSGDQPFHDDIHSSWQNWRPVTDIEQETDDKAKSKGFCGLFRCWNWHLPRSFELSPERYHGRRFFWGVRFCSLPSLFSQHLNQVTNILTYNLSQ